MERRTWEEYVAFIWDKSRNAYIRLGTSRFRTFAECYENVKYRIEHDSAFMYKSCDWSNIRIKKSVYTCTDWGFVNE